jgi:hypothetical protein
MAYDCFHQALFAVLLSWKMSRAPGDSESGRDSHERGYC